VFLSKEGNFVGVQELAYLDQKFESPRPLTFTLYDAQGKKLWSLSRPLGADTPMPSFYLSNLGTLVMVEPLEGLLSFFDQAGSLVQEVSLFPKTLAEMERPVACTFSENGSYFVVNALKSYSRPSTQLSPREKGHSYLILFDDQGTEIWRHELAHEVSMEVETSPGGEFIVAGGYSVKGLNAVERATYLYDLEGNLEHTYEFPFRYADFSSDGGFLLIGQKYSLHLVETNTGQVLWEHLLSSKAGQIRALDLSPDGHLTLVEQALGRYQGPQFVYQSPQILLFDQEGHQVWEKMFPEERFLQPLVKFLDESSRFLLAFDKRYLIYAENQ
jgi:WD40 repeat protein